MPEGVFRAGNFELKLQKLVGSSGVEVDLTLSTIINISFELSDSMRLLVK